MKRVTLILILVAAVTGGCGSTQTPQQSAAGYIRALSPDATRVQASVQVVAIDIGSKTSINQVALDAQQAHDSIDSIRNDFAGPSTTSDGTLGNDEAEVFAAVNDMKNAMGALVAYTGSPNPATLAQFNLKYTQARQEWNQGVRAVWRTAAQGNAPTI